jgi:hypothetical protein
MANDTSTRRTDDKGLTQNADDDRTLASVHILTVVDMNERAAHDRAIGRELRETFMSPAS